MPKKKRSMTAPRSRTHSAPKARKAAAPRPAEPLSPSIESPVTPPPAPPHAIPMETPPASMQLVPVPVPAPEHARFPVGMTISMLILLIISASVNIKLWSANNATTRSLQTLSAQMAEQTPAEISVNALASNLKAFEGKRVQIGPLALRSNAAHAAQLTVRSNTPQSAPIDVFYENALNSPQIRALAPSKNTNVTIVGRCYRYENTPDSWYVEAEAVMPQSNPVRIQ